jgi:hypothetical protein
MISSRATASTSHAPSQAVSSPKEVRAQVTHQDDQGPLDRELLDLYVAILIVVPFAWLLRSWWF